MNRLITVIWLIILGAVFTMLSAPESREVFRQLTLAYPYTMGFLKIGILGAMGELLGGRIVTGGWRLTSIRLHQRMLVWGFLGWLFTAVFPLFSFGVDGLLDVGLIPGAGSTLAAAFWKSFFMNLIFAFPMMVFHRVTDSLIERGELFSAWPLVEVYTNIDWRNMFRIVGAACIRFWIPAHTFTFLLPVEFRVVCAALLAVVLGAILGFAKKRAQSRV
ncbi:MAG: hypothetical protein K8R59_04115 [Thermoanaerobaculales bacterium]|nr:hypothetical protein [Thermoanaerobaculales bacterium]